MKSLFKIMFNFKYHNSIKLRLIYELALKYISRNWFEYNYKILILCDFTIF